MTTGFEISVSHDSDRVLIALAGELDATHTADVRATIGQLLDSGHPDLVIDLTALEFLDSNGLGSIVGAHRVTRDAGGRLTVRGARGRVQDLLAMTGVDAVLNIEEQRGRRADR